MGSLSGRESDGLSALAWMAAIARSMSVSVLEVSDTLIRIARRPFQLVPPIHASPPRCSLAMTASVSSSFPNATRT